MFLSSFLETVSPLSIPNWPVVLFVGLRLCGCYSLYFDMSVSIVLVQFQFGESYWCNFMCIVSNNIKRHNIWANSMIWILQFLIYEEEPNPLLGIPSLFGKLKWMWAWEQVSNQCSFVGFVCLFVSRLIACVSVLVPSVMNVTCKLK